MKGHSTHPSLALQLLCDLCHVTSVISTILVGRQCIWFSETKYKQCQMNEYKWRYLMLLGIRFKCISIWGLENRGHIFKL